MKRNDDGEGSMEQELAGTRDAAKPDEAGKSARKHIDPERLYKAIRFLKAHPKQQVRQFQPRIFDHGHRTMRGAYHQHAEHSFRSMSSDPVVK
jgi:hypothetical protein